MANPDFLIAIAATDFAPRWEAVGWRTGLKPAPGFANAECFNRSILIDAFDRVG